jgi:hypothetical protein
MAHSGSLLVGGLGDLSDDDDDDLDLDTYMTGLSMSRTALRRNGGDGGSPMDHHPMEERGHPPGGQTPATWSGARAGTSSVTSDYVYGQPGAMYGQAATVYSQEEGGRQVPKSVSLSEGRGSGTKKYKLFEVPRVGRGLEEICFSLIGQGTTFCTARNCKTSHKGDIFRPTPGHLFVSKTASTAFADPKCSVMFLTPDLLVDWNSAARTISEWSRLFMLVNTTSSEGPTSHANLEAKEDFAHKAEAHRTPGKRKAAVESSPIAMRASPYMRQLIGPSADEERPFNWDSAEAWDILKHLDVGLEKATHFMADLSEEQGTFAREENLAIRALEHKVEKLKREVGEKPEALSADYESPTVWGSIGALGSHLDAFEKPHADPTELVSLEVKRALGPLKTQLIEASSKRTSALEARINKIKAFALKSTKHLQQAIDDQLEDSDLGDATRKFVPPSQSPGKWAEDVAPTQESRINESKPEWVADVIKSFETRIENLSTRMAQITAENDEQAIRFAGLGFRSAREANAWLVINMPGHHCGLIVDVHTVFEHIQIQSFGQDSIKTMESLSKLKIKTMADGIAMTSFEQKIPRFFKKAAVHKVVRDDSSHFDTIVSYDEWDAPGSGFRVQLKDELVTFRAAHLEIIDSVLDRDSKARAIASMALTESVSWIEGFIVFLDDYHRDLTKAKFGTKKAWNVTTRLGKRILEEVANPRNGVSNSFEAGNNEQVCQRILWAVLRSQDVMARYKRNGFKDDPTVSAELVKFMAVNTGFDALEVMVAKVKTMEAEAVASKKETAAAVKAASSAGNKSDELKKVVDLLIKRIVKLEK